MELGISFSSDGVKCDDRMLKHIELAIWWRQKSFCKKRTKQRPYATFRTQPLFFTGYGAIAPPHLLIDHCHTFIVPQQSTTFSVANIHFHQQLIFLHFPHLPDTSDIPTLT